MLACCHESSVCKFLSFIHLSLCLKLFYNLWAAFLMLFLSFCVYFSLVACLVWGKMVHAGWGLLCFAFAFFLCEVGYPQERAKITACVSHAQWPVISHSFWASISWRPNISACAFLQGWQDQKSAKMIRAPCLL